MKTPCPRCKRTLEQCGEVVVEGESFAVFQCDDCIEPMQFGGESFDAAYTFALRPDGTTFDPSADDLTE
ncbi:MAG: hypothetical protein K8T89_23000 [Planctomycetes bacterium]|nr:hypothetical protein [Planctomycetota bacterium]